MLAAFLTTAAALEHARSPDPADQAPLTRNETARLFTVLRPGPARGTRHILTWSCWRRRHQHRARACHYQRQAGNPCR